ncbi:hypothetical protein H0274_04640 [Altererythrobacter sp. CC-YST694]|uniref:hypothetical protein n=1 Tax=Altererythrobacter sp. CC-YST694 TaxID=2755038 RepID=UPI001D0235A0|nr:hypothetical protein [Altererythrobacter sp. CC-YST694]MCB5424536.1 hypothetical protein [Altererythrobacter sp. CC-YST694]
MFRVFNPARSSNRMSISKGFVSSLVLAVATIGGTAAGVAGLAAPAHAQSDAPQYSKKFAKAAQPVSDQLNAARSNPAIAADLNNLVAASKKLAAAKTQADFAAAEAEFQQVGKVLQGKTTAERAALEALAGQAQGADEKYMVGEFQVFLGSFTGDIDLSAQGIKTKIASGALKPEKVAPSWFELGQLYFDHNRYADAQSAFESAYQAGETNGAVYAAECFFRANRVAEGVDYLRKVIDARIAAGQEVPLAWAGSGLNHSLELRDAARVASWGGLYAKLGKTPQSWQAGIAQLMRSQEFDLQEKLDLYRLMSRTGSLLNAADYVGYIDAADPRSLPNEVVPVINDGIKRGLLATSAANAPAGMSDQLIGFTQKSLELANSRADAERKSAATIAADAQKDPKGETARDAGEVYQSFGASADAERLYQLALSKGGVDNNRVLMRLAIAQADQGKFADARANFAKVTGPRAPIATLWLAWLDTKAAPAG